MQKFPGVPAEGVVEDPAPAPDELRQRGIHPGRADPVGDRRPARQAELFDGPGQVDVLDELVADAFVAAGGDVGVLADQDVLAVGEGQLLGRVVGPEQGVILDQDDPEQGLRHRLPEALAAHLGQEAGHARVVRPGVFEDDAQAIGLVAGVGVDEPEPLAPGLPARDVEGVGLAGPAWREILDRDQADPGVGLGDPSGDLGRPVGAPVVDDEDFEVRVRLRSGPSPGSRRGSSSSSLAGMIAETSGGSGWS